MIIIKRGDYAQKLWQILNLQETKPWQPLTKNRWQSTHMYS